MNVLFISPHFPPNFRHFVFALRAEGAKVIGIGDVPGWDVAEDVGRELAEYVHVPDMYNRYDDLRNAVKGLISRHGPIGRVDSQNEYWLGIEAQLRDEFGISGQRQSDLLVNRRKSGMKDAFVRAGVKVAPAARATSAADVRGFVKQHGFPIILKPDVGVGASGAKRIDDADTLERYLESMPGDLLVESFVKGAIVTYDGLADRDGNVIFETSHQYNAGIMEIVQLRLPIHYSSVRDLPAELARMGRACVRAFNVRERFFHIEFFLTPKGEYYGLEINVRPPGGFTMDMMNYSADIDLYRAWARLIVHGDNRLEYARKYVVAHVGRRAERRYKRSAAEVAEKCPAKFVHVPFMPHLWRPVMGDEVFLLGDESKEKVDKAVAWIEEQE